MNTMSDCNMTRHLEIADLRRMNQSTHLPSGENLISCTDFWKLKWCRTTPRRAFTKSARPSSSTEIKTFPSGLSAMTAIFFLFSTGNVKDLLLYEIFSLPWQNFKVTLYLTRSKTEIRFPTGLYREFPSCVKIRFPCLYTVPSMLEN